MMKNKTNLLILLILTLSLVGCGNGDVQSTNYTVSGIITDGQGGGVGGVRVTFSQNYVAVTTDGSGRWMKDRLSGEVVVTPVHDTYSFEPQSRVVSRESSDVNFQLVMAEVLTVEELEPIKVDYGASPNVFLPQEVNVNLDNGTVVKMGVTWDNGTPTYNAQEPGEYLFKGDLVLPSYAVNPRGIKAEVNVTLSALYVWGVDTVPDVKVKYDTPLNDLNLPESIIVTLNTFDRQRVDLLWDMGDPTYDPAEMGIYQFTGELILPDHIDNPNNLAAKTRVIVQKGIKKVEELEEMDIPYGTPLENLGLPERVKVTLEDDSESDVSVIWDEGSPTYDSTAVGTFTFTGTLDVPEYILNPQGYRARIVITIITYSISGWVTENGVGLEGVDITFSENTITPEVTDAQGFWSKGGLKGPVTVIPSKAAYIFEPEEREVKGESNNVDFTALKKTAVVSVSTILFGTLRIFGVTVHRVDNVENAVGFALLDLDKTFAEIGGEITMHTMEDTMPLYILDELSEEGTILGYANLNFENVTQAHIPLLP